MAGDLAAARQLGERGQGDMLGVDLEESPQRRAGLAAAEAVGAERQSGRRAPSGAIWSGTIFM